MADGSEISQIDSTVDCVVLPDKPKHGANLRNKSTLILIRLCVRLSSIPRWKIHREVIPQKYAASSTSFNVMIFPLDGGENKLCSLVILRALYALSFMPTPNVIRPYQKWIVLHFRSEIASAG